MLRGQGMLAADVATHQRSCAVGSTCAGGGAPRGYTAYMFLVLALGCTPSTSPGDDSRVDDTADTADSGVGHVPEADDEPDGAQALDGAGQGVIADAEDLDFWRLELPAHTFTRIVIDGDDPDGPLGAELDEEDGTPIANRPVLDGDLLAWGGEGRTGILCIRRYTTTNAATWPAPVGYTLAVSTQDAAAEPDSVEAPGLALGEGNAMGILLEEPGDVDWFSIESGGPKIFVVGMGGGVEAALRGDFSVYTPDGTLYAQGSQLWLPTLGGALVVGAGSSNGAGWDAARVIPYDFDYDVEVEPNDEGAQVLPVVGGADYQSAMVFGSFGAEGDVDRYTVTTTTKGLYKPESPLSGPSLSEVTVELQDDRGQPVEPGADILAGTYTLVLRFAGTPDAGAWYLLGFSVDRGHSDG